MGRRIRRVRAIELRQHTEEVMSEADIESAVPAKMQRRALLPRSGLGFKVGEDGYPIEAADDARDAARWRALVRGVAGRGDVQILTDAHQPHAEYVKGSAFLSVSFWSERDVPMHRYLSVCRLFAYADKIIAKQKKGV